MNVIPLFVFIALQIGQLTAEHVAMRRTGSSTRKHTREWTLYAVALPFKAMIVGSVVDHLVLKTQPTAAMVVAGSLLGVAGVAIRVRGHFELGRDFSLFIEKSDDHRIVQAGMYSKIRHPMYVGSILLFVGMPLVLASKVGLLCAALGIVAILIRIPREEKFLCQEFPEYREYMQRTWRLIPYVC